MALADCSLERFPDHLIENFDDLEHADQLEIELPDIEAEERAHRRDDRQLDWATSHFRVRQSLPFHARSHLCRPA